jgi:hypothetical protein
MFIPGSQIDIMSQAANDVMVHEGAARLRGRDAAGNPISIYLPLNEVSTNPNKSISQMKNYIYAIHANGNQIKTQTLQVGFYAESLRMNPYVYSFAALPWNVLWDNIQYFSVRFKVRFSSVASNQALISSTCASGSNRFFLTRSTTELILYTYNAAGTSVNFSTSGLGLQINTNYEVQFTYDGRFADGSCLATISVNGVSKASSTTAKLLPIPAMGIGSPLMIGARATDDSTYGFSPASYNAFMNVVEFQFYPTTILPATYTPLVAALQPFALTTAGNGAGVSLIAKFSALHRYHEWSGLTCDDESVMAVAVGSPGWQWKVQINNDPQETSGWSDWMTWADLKIYLITARLGQYVWLGGRCISNGLSAFYPIGWISLDVVESASGPPIPIMSNYNRTGATATVDALISDGMSDEDLKVEVYARALLGLNQDWFLAGYRWGSGSVALSGLPNTFDLLAGDIPMVDIFAITTDEGEP